jgi:prophage regulatory protein
MNETVLRLSQVRAKTGLPTSSIYKRISEGEFPKQINLGGRSVGWLESDINNWIRHRLAESRFNDTDSAA